MRMVKINVWNPSIQGYITTVTEDAAIKLHDAGNMIRTADLKFVLKKDDQGYFWLCR